MTLIDVRIQDDEHGRLGIAASTSRAHWLAPRPAVHRHGSGIDGDVEVAGRLTVHSLVRGPWELRLVRADALASSAAGLILRVGGWPLAGDAPAADVDGPAAVVRPSGCGAASAPSSETARPAIGVAPRREPARRRRRRPLPRPPSRRRRVGRRARRAVRRAGRSTSHDASVSLDERDGATTVTATWPDGLVTHESPRRPRSRLTRTGSPTGTRRRVLRNHKGVARMKRKFAAAAGVAVVATLALAACSGGDRRELGALGVRRPRHPQPVGLEPRHHARVPGAGRRVPRGEPRRHDRAQGLRRGGVQHPPHRRPRRRRPAPTSSRRRRSSSSRPSSRAASSSTCPMSSFPTASAARPRTRSTARRTRCPTATTRGSCTTTRRSSTPPASTTPTARGRGTTTTTPPPT